MHNPTTLSGHGLLAAGRALSLVSYYASLNSRIPVSRTANPILLKKHCATGLSAYGSQSSGRVRNDYHNLPTNRCYGSEESQVPDIGRASHEKYRIRIPV